MEQKTIKTYSGREVIVDTSDLACAAACCNLNIPVLKYGDRFSDRFGTKIVLGASVENGRWVLWHCYLGTVGAGYRRPPP